MAHRPARGRPPLASTRTVWVESPGLPPRRQADRDRYMGPGHRPLGLRRRVASSDFRGSEVFPEEGRRRPNRGVQLGQAAASFSYADEIGSRHEPVVGWRAPAGKLLSWGISPAGGTIVQRPSAPMARAWRRLPASTSACATPTPAIRSPLWDLIRAVQSRRWRTALMVFRVASCGIRRHILPHSSVGRRDPQGSGRLARTHGRSAMKLLFSSRTGRGWFRGTNIRTTRGGCGTRGHGPPPWPS